VANEHITRKLTTILAADVEGYTRLMRADEETTLRTLGEYRDGDSVLAEFGSAVEAVRCAISCQEEISGRNAELADDRKLMFRIGVNVGDVMVRDGDLFGDGVKVAARLEGLAEAGGVCISGSLFEQIKHKLSVGFEDMGPQEVKNLPEPVSTYRLVPGQVSVSAGATVAAKPSGAGGWQADETEEELPAQTLPDKPSIAVLPFDNMSGNREQEYFGDGLAEDIITTLSKISSLFVIARNSSFAFKGKAVDVREIAADLGVRYVLEGSVRQSANRLRINAELIDALDGHHLWAERYDRELTDIFDIQDEMTREIVSALRLKLSDGEQAQIWLRGTENIVAWSSAMQALELVMQGSPTDNAQARELFENAHAEDPGYTLALAWIGKTHYLDIRFGFSASPEESLTNASQIGEQALRQNPNEAYAHNLVSLVRSSQGRYEEAVAAARNAASLSPNDAYIKLGLARVLINAGYPEEAEVHMREAMRLNPFHHTYYFGVLANALEQLGRDDEAVDVLQKAVARDPDYFAGHLRLASLYGLAGRIDEAKTQAAEVLRINPRFDLSRAPSFYLTTNPDFLERFVDGLRKAGVPE
jgi:adenylate cyclase